jgi:hypothetical protein
VRRKPERDLKAQQTLLAVIEMFVLDCGDER